MTAAVTDAAADPAAAAALPKTPYRGIEPFRYVDRAIFFAREEETSRLLRYVAVYRGVLFYGGSGSGKSSLVNAGFIPAAIEEGFTPDRLRVQPRPGEEIVVERISSSPGGGAPYLPSNLVAPDEPAARVVLPAAGLRERLHARPKEGEGKQGGRRPLLIFDQFEEFATLFEAVPRGDAVRQAQEAQAAILKAVGELLRDPALPVKLLFVFREDHLAKLNKLVALFPDLSDQYLRLTPPATDALPSIIRGSFEKFPGRFGKELSADLTARLSEAIEARSEGGRLNLSEVQIACLELWKSANPEELFRQKGVQGLLEGYLSDALGKLPANLRDPAVALLSRMVTPSGTRNVVSEYDLISQVHDDERIPEERLKSALQALVQDTRLVRRERRYDTHFYDIVSEFLVPWIMQQKAERLTQAERRKKVASFALALFSLLVAAAVGAGAWYIWSQRTEAAIARDEVRKAMEEKNRAENLRVKHESYRIDAEQQRDEALRLKAQAEQERDRVAAERQQQVNDLTAARLAAEQQRDQARAEAARTREEVTAGFGRQLEEVNARVNSLQEQIRTKDQEIERRKKLQVAAEEEEQVQRARAITAERNLAACRNRRPENYR